MKKILLSSDCHGRFDILFPKVQQICDKNCFDFMLLVGEVLSSQSTKIIKDIIQQKIKIPLPTYFIDSSETSSAFSVCYPNGYEITSNFYFLGRRGYKEIQGLKIAFLSGISKSGLPLNSQYNGKYFTSEDVEKLLQNEDKVDILLTNQWPLQFETEQKPEKNLLISRLCERMSPHYHIASGGKSYFRMKPFINFKGNPTHFINIAEINQELPKDKYLLAIQIDPQKKEEPKETIENPFLLKKDEGKSLRKQRIDKEKQEMNIIDGNSYLYFIGFPKYVSDSEITEFLERWGEIKGIQINKQAKKNTRNGLVKFANVKDAEICLKDSGKYTLYNNRIKFQLKQQNQKYRREDCYLCKGKPNFDESLLIKCGKYSYIALDKGPIIDKHFQIVPLNHVGNLYELESEEMRQISNIVKSLSSKIKLKQQTLITFQRYMWVSDAINHCILHCLVIQEKQKEIVEKFMQLNLNRKYEFKDMDFFNRHKQIQYEFFIDISFNQSKFRKTIKRKSKDFEFIRTVVCQLLDKPQSLNWRACELSQSHKKQSLQMIEEMTSGTILI